MEVTEINYHTLLWIEHLLSAKIGSSDEHMCHAIKDLIYQIEVVRGLIRVKELDNEKDKP
jgi:hypothetical protein